MSIAAVARAFARTCADGVLEGPGPQDRRVAVAFSAEGDPLVPAPSAACAPGAAVRLVLAAPRATLHLEGSVADAPEEAARLHALHPDAGPALRIRVEAARWTPAVPDLGAPALIEAAAWRLSTPAWKAAEGDITAHMNADHEDAMQRLCRVHHGFDPARAQLVAVDPEGLLIRGDARLVHVAFDAPAPTMDDVHHATVRLARAARLREAQALEGAPS